MDNTCTVLIQHKTKDGEVYLEKEYSLADYTKLVASEMIYLVVDVENAFYEYEGQKNKAEWSKNGKKRFGEIRHKILDYANSVKRLPENLRVKPIEVMKVSEMIADVLNS